MEEQFFYHVQTRDVDAVKIMLAAHPTIAYAMNEDTDSALHIAAHAGFPEMLECILQFTNDPNVSGCACRTPLHCACHEGDLDCVQVLLRHGASLGWLDAMEETPLHKAARYGHEEILQLLLSRRPSRAVLDQQNVLGSTALHQAMERGNESCAKMLMQAGCNTETEDFFGCKPVFVPKPVPREWMYQ
eukprot:TRINITY_DN2758_c0_g1_i2.p1 TRINITY_DN2758_c0_g1~~TRINITY_DN2758_c0_g1_i2.p1  ORF type:complete len:196 (+),score=27.56 TRINITY_DN2758_c0_g1_i2:26-589(+)